ncbi:hypothetical protein RUM44_008197 [Polyplax serrata]|uniref:Uncharacterized protein n=1 Tax=Polyplax serrata TaxID=468196 RepID=A0ABR1B7U7_POLSC
MDDKKKKKKKKNLKSRTKIKQKQFSKKKLKPIERPTVDISDFHGPFRDVERHLHSKPDCKMDKSNKKSANGPCSEIYGRPIGENSVRAIKSSRCFASREVTGETGTGKSSEGKTTSHLLYADEEFGD